MSVQAEIEFWEAHYAAAEAEQTSRAKRAPVTEPEPLTQPCPVTGCGWHIELQLQPLTLSPYITDPQLAHDDAVGRAVAAESARIETALSEHGAGHPADVWLTACQDATADA